MAYQTYLNNRSHKSNSPNWLFPSISTTTATNPSSASIPPSPDGIESAITSSDSGTDSTFSFSAPVGLGSDAQESDLPSTTTFGDLGGFKSYQGGDMDSKDDNGGNVWNPPPPPTHSYPNSVSIHLPSNRSFINSSANTGSETCMMQNHDYSYVHGSDVGAGEASSDTMSASPACTSTTPFASTTPLSSTATSTPTPPASSSAATFQFSFRMAPPYTNQRTQGQKHRGGRKKTHSPTASTATGSFSSDMTSKPLTLQFNTRNGQPVLSLSTPAREAAALRERIKKEKQERNASANTTGGETSNGMNGNPPMGSQGQEMNETHAREDNWTWRNIKPAPAPGPVSSVANSAQLYPPPPAAVPPTSGQPARPQQPLVQPQNQPPDLQEYHNAYAPYDMYEEMIHDSIGTQVGPSVGLERAHMQAQAQLQAQHHTRPQDSSQSLHNAAQASQHFRSHFQLGNPYPSVSSPSSTDASTPTFTPVSNSNIDASNSVAMSGPSPRSGNPYTVVQSVSQANGGGGDIVNGGGREQQVQSLSLNGVGGDIVNGGGREQQVQSLSLAPSTSQDHYPSPQGARMMQSSHVNNISTSHPHSRHEASALTPVPPSAFFRRPTGACTRCKRMKMKCTFPPITSGATGGLHAIPEAEVDFNVGPSPDPLPPSLACTRCAAANHACIVEGRKPRTPSQREALLASLRQKEAIIATLIAPFQPSEQDANIMLNGAKIIEAMDKGKDKAINDIGDDGLSPAPDVGSAFKTSGNTIGPVERAALLANDKGSLAKEGRSRYGKNKFTSQKRLAASNQHANANSSDEDSLSSDNSDYHDSDEDDIWDNEVEKAVLDSSHSRNATPSVQASEEVSSVQGQWGKRETSASTATLRRPHARSGLENVLKMHLHTLPPLNTPLGTIARLSLEGMGEKPRPKSKPTDGTRYPKVKVEGDTESVSALAGQKRRREANDAGDQERDGVLEDDEISDGDEESGDRNSGGVDLGEVSAEESTEPADARSITLSAAQTLSLSSLVITESDGPAHRAYFAPGLVSNLPLRRIINARAPAPPILSSGLVTWEECETLFDIYYEYVHPYCSVLDPVLHTVQTVYERDPFLFTVILAVSSRYYTDRPVLYKVAMHYAKAAAAIAFVNGIKSIEMVQAYLIMCTYGLPARRWEEDRSWFYGGLAFRIATDLNLDKSFDDFKIDTKMGSLTGSTNSLSERQEREKLNRMRTWLNCFNVDRSSSTQWGKPTALIEGEPIRKAREWWRCSLYNHPYDLHLVAYTELLRIVSRFHEQTYSDPMSKTGLNKNANFQKITEQIEADIKDWHDNTRWHYDSATTKSSNPSSRSPTASSPSPAPTVRSSSKARALYSPAVSSSFSSRRSPPMGDLESDPALIVRIEGVPVFENYMRLVMYSFGFEQAWRKWKARRSKGSKMDVSKNMMLTMDMDLDLDGGDMFFVKCLHAASAVVRHLSDVYGPSGYLKYAPDCFFVMGGFCGAFLLKMLRPAFAPLLDSTQRERIIQVVTRFVDVLDSSQASIDGAHTPRLYAKFLRGVIKDVIVSASRVDAKKASDSNETSTAGAEVPNHEASSFYASSTSTGLTAPTPSLNYLPSPSTTATSVIASPFEAPSLLFSHAQPPGSEACRTPNGHVNTAPVMTGSASLLRMEPDTGRGINPALVVSGPLMDQERNRNSGASTPVASSTPTPTLSSPRPSSVSTSNSGLNAIGHAFDMHSRWSSLSQANNQVLGQQGLGGGYVGYSNQAHVPSEYFRHQSWPQNGVRNTNVGDLGVGLGAAVMAHADANMNNEVGEGYAYNGYMQSGLGAQSRGQGQVGPHSQYQLQGSHETGSLSTTNQQQFVPYAAFQQSISPQLLSLPSTTMTSHSMDLTDDEFLATMHAVSSDNWNSSVIMPGYGWGPDEDIGMCDA